jgi:NAD(P)-dependent dehydrogenase (short-subunit alcohol dehydrogenase family)
VAERLASGGARLALLGRDPARLEMLARALATETLPIAVDVRDRDAVHDAFRRTAARLGAVHAVVANAGSGGPNAPGAADRWDEIVRTNLDGTYHTLRAFEAVLAPGPEPRHAVVISSCLARFGVAGSTAYCASKAGLLGLVRALAHEWAPQGVRVNAICPGWVDTGMAQARMRELAADAGRSYQETRAEQLAAVALKRISEPAEIAGVVEFLLAADARAFTGQALDPNNGAWMG